MTLTIEAPTDPQLAFIRELCRERGYLMPPVHSKQEASILIDEIRSGAYPPPDWTEPPEDEERFDGAEPWPESGPTCIACLEEDVRNLASERDAQEEALRALYFNPGPPELVQRVVTTVLGAYTSKWLEARPAEEIVA